MKTVSKDGRTWFEKRDGKTYVGFTKAFLESLDGCWHIIPAANNRTAVKEDAPLCAVETNEGLFSVPSPVTGIISVFENAAMNFPDKLLEENTVAVMSDPKQVEEEVEADAQRRRNELNAALARLGDDAARGVNWDVQPGAALDFFANAGVAAVVNERNVLRGGNR